MRREDGTSYLQAGSEQFSKNAPLKFATKNTHVHSLGSTD
jgi:hypothetical protein